MNIKKGKKLGQGIMGEVYESSINDTPCVLKIEKNDPNIDVGNNAYARQVKFDQWVKKSKYKKHYLNLMAYGWLDNCKINIPVPKWIPGDKKSIFNLAQS